MKKSSLFIFGWLKMIDTKYYVNVRDLMMLPRPRLRLTLHNERAETIEELGIIQEGYKAC